MTDETQKTPAATAATAAAAVDVAALSLRVRALIEDPQLARAIRELWTDCEGPPDQEPDFVVSVAGEGPWQVDAEEFHETAQAFPAAVAAACAAINVTLATRTPLLAVHAAVVRTARSTLLIPGESGAGKTTLTVALLQAGWEYATDEAFAMNWESAETRAYPRPLGISDWTAQTLATPAGIAGVGERFMRAKELGATVASGSLSVDHVVLPDRTEPVEAPRLEPVHRAEALEVLVRQGFTHYYNPRRTVELLAGVVLGAQTWHLRYDDPADAARLLGAELSANTTAR